MKHITFLLLALLWGLSTLARDFEYEGIWYTVLDEEAKTCETRAGSRPDKAGNRVKGCVLIPASVYDGINK